MFVVVCCWLVVGQKGVKNNNNKKKRRVRDLGWEMCLKCSMIIISQQISQLKCILLKLVYICVLSF